MKHALTIYEASPRLQGNSAYLASVFAVKAEALYETVDTVYLDRKTIHPCKACDACKKDGVCIQKDDMNDLIPQFVASDAVLFSTPVYWWGVAAQLKLFIDRLYMLPHDKFTGKELYVIAVGEEKIDGIQYSLIDRQFKEIAEYLNMNYRGLLPFSADADVRKAKDQSDAIEKVEALLKGEAEAVPPVER